MARTSGLWSQEELGLELGSWRFQVLIFLEWHPVSVVGCQNIFYVPGALGSLENFLSLVSSWSS